MWTKESVLYKLVLATSTQLTKRMKGLVHICYAIKTLIIRDEKIWFLPPLVAALDHATMVQGMPYHAETW